MIRRLTVTLLAVALTAVLASGCSTFSRNDSAAVVNGHELSIDDFERLVSDFAGDADALGDFNGTNGRELLTAWVTITALQDALEQQGLVVDPEQRAAAEQQISAADPERWATWGQPSKDLQVAYVSSTNAIAQSHELIDDSQLEATYNGGKEQSGLLCLRIMAFDSVAEASAAQDELEAGAEFAVLADQHPLDPSAPPNGGIFANLDTGEECLSTTDFADLAAALGDSEVGLPTQPITLENFTYLFLERPYEEVADKVRASLGPTIAGELARSFVASIDATIDSRYGMWDKEAGQVVPTR